MSIPLTNVQPEPAALPWRVGRFPQTLASLPASGADGNRQDHTSQILEFTRVIFSGEVTFLEVDDPEIPDHRYLVFQVTADGPIEQLAAQNDEWHRRLCQLPDRIPGRYRLSILAE